MIKTVFARIGLSLVLTIALLSQMACTGGPLSKLDSTIDYAPAFFTYLSSKGYISAQLASSLSADTQQIPSKISAAKAKLSAISDSDPQKKWKQYQVYLELANEIRAIVTNNHFQSANNEQVAKFATLVLQIMDIVLKRNQPPTFGAEARPSDDKLEAKIDELNRLLKQRN